MIPTELVAALALASPRAPAELWPKLAFEQGSWSAAIVAVEEDGAVARASLLRLLRLEEEAARENEGEERFPPDPKIGSAVLANHWEAWALAAAFEGATSDSLGRALDHAIARSTAGYPQRQRPRLEATRDALTQDLGAPAVVAEDRRAALASGAGGAFEVLDGGMLPSPVEGRLVLLAGSYRFRDALRVPAGTELWIERGSTLSPAGKDARIHVSGALRVFGATERGDVTIGGRRSWLGVEYESDVHHSLTNVRIEGAARGLEIKGSRVHLLDAVIEDCGIGIEANTYNVWCESTVLTGCS
ncbi:MAG: hypothetical protein AAF957_24205 [Planctomycetota bacterium]